MGKQLESQEPKKRPGRKALEVSLHPVAFEDAVDALLDTKPSPKDKEVKPKK